MVGADMGFVWIGAAAFLIWLLQGILYQKFWMRGLAARAEFESPEIREADQSALKEIVENRKILPLPTLQVNLQVDRSLVFASQSNVTVSDQAYRRDIFSLLPYQRITRRLEFTGTHRGYFRCGQLELVGRDLFFEGPFVKKMNSDAELYVFPKRIAMEPVEAACQEMLGEYFWKKKLYEDPFAFQGIRDYEVWDGFRQVNWKASAKTRQLKVNVFENTALPQVQVLLNLEQDDIWADEILAESVIRVGAALAEQWIAQGIPVEVRTNGKDVLTGQYGCVEAGAGGSHLRTVLQMLSRVQVPKTAEGRGTSWGEAAAEGRGTSWGEAAAEGRGVLWGGNPAQMIVYVAASQDVKKLAMLQRCMDQGATCLWIRPVLPGQDKPESRSQMHQGYAVSMNEETAASVYHGPVKQWRITR